MTGMYDPRSRLSDKMGGTGSAHAQYVLTVRAHQANSHRGIGWEEFTDAAIMALNSQGPSDRVHPVGRSGAEEKIDAE